MSLRMIPGLFLLLIQISAAPAASIDIEVLGLFKNAALLSIDGEQTLLKAGETANGVRLVSATSKQAVIDIAGESLTLNLSTRINTSFEVPEEVTVSILLNGNGQYKTAGRINGRRVSLLVDTGANVVAISSVMGRSLGIDMSKGRAVYVTTASGKVASTMVSLDSVQIGAIRLLNVQAAIIEGDFPEEILLGMSFLKDVDIHESGGVMSLTAKF